MPSLFASTAPPGVPWRAGRAGDDYGASATPNWREIDWPAQLRSVEIDGAKVNYVDIGPTGRSAEGGAADGEKVPLVLVHGLAGQWQNWLENIPRLAQERRVVAPDLPGFGLSEMPRERITIGSYGRFVDALCGRLGLERVVVVGNSMGGFIGAEVAIEFATRVERLVLVSAAGITSANLYRAPVLTLGRIGTVLAVYTAARHNRLAVRPGTRHLALGLVARYPGRLKADLAYEGFMKGVGKEGFDDALRACLEYDFQDRLPEIRCPTLVMWGENDAILPFKDAEEFERLIPDSRKLVMKETGHVPMAERPEKFNQALLDFMAEEGRADRPADLDSSAFGEAQKAEAQSQEAQAA